MINYLYHANEPYPEIRVENKNKYYAEILMDDYAGFISEFTYNSFGWKTDLSRFF